ncbi:MAG: hypothetical protein JHC35_06895 [Sulfuricurvum sp.]|uniref:hypothetical protein n=1 Tax=Sulfuricurvum sp. TaxID=2025608 RepID=UPI0025F15D53|nr:hypothetical protein [Sulfuricurvum sp.]MCI4406994.1 hypothetical protein [Sulfuricurvum sp.]
MDLLINFSQFMIYILLILTVYRLRIVPSWIALYLAFLGTSPFWFNGFLFPPEYMPDQFKYLNVIQSVRNVSNTPDVSSNVFYSGWIMAFIPIPFVYNVIGVAFINKFIFLILFLWLYKKKYLSGVPLFFILFYPDLIMYSSLALRDILILTFMIIGTVLLVQKRYIFALIMFLPLLLIKFQNFALMMILWIMSIAFMREKFIKSKHSILYFSMFFLVVLSIFILLAPYVIEPLDFYRGAMSAEDGNRPEDYVSLSGTGELLTLGLTSSIYFLLKPFFFEAANALQLVQSFLNIGVFVFLAWFTVKCYKINKFKTLFWLSFLMFSMIIYGLVVVNFGTAARYRFPFVVLYVIAIGVDVYQNRVIKSRQLKVKI